MGIKAKCDWCEKEEPMTVVTSRSGGGDRFKLPLEWKYRPVTVPASQDAPVEVVVACSEPCLLRVVESGEGSGAHKLPPPPPPARQPKVEPPKKGDRGKK